MNEFFWKHDAAIKSFFIVILLVLVMWIVSLQSQLTFVPATTPEAEPSRNDVCGDECKKAIAEIVSESVATISAEPKTVVSKAKTAPKQQVTYIPLSGDFSTRNTNWQDVTKSEVYIDLAEYGEDVYSDWEATLKAVSGRATVRLFDVTHSIAVGSSEIESSSSAFKTSASPPLNLWQGNNLYRVQLKSLDGSEVFFDSGKIKIVAK